MVQKEHQEMICVAVYRIVMKKHMHQQIHLLRHFGLLSLSFVSSLLYLLFKLSTLEIYLFHVIINAVS